MEIFQSCFFFTNSDFKNLFLLSLSALEPPRAGGSSEPHLAFLFRFTCSLLHVTKSDDFVDHQHSNTMSSSSSSSSSRTLSDLNRAINDIQPEMDNLGALNHFSDGDIATIDASATTIKAQCTSIRKERLQRRKAGGSTKKATHKRAAAEAKDAQKVVDAERRLVRAKLERQEKIEDRRRAAELEAKLGLICLLR